jgi:integrase
MGIRVREWKGEWRIFVNHLGKRKAKKIGPGSEGQKLANQLADRLRVRLAYGEELDAPKSVPLFRDYAEGWIRQVKITKKAGTAETYEGHMRRVWIPAFGKYPVDRITRSMVKRQLVKLQESGFSRNAVLAMLTALQSCCSECVDDELIPRNPADRQARSLAPSPQKVHDIFTEDELDRLFAAAIERWPSAYVKILVMARTGMREGEMLALQPVDVDFHRRQIWVRRTWGSRNTGKQMLCVNTPKSGKWRWVDMSPKLAEVLQDYMAQLPADSPWLFPGGKGDKLPMHPAGSQWVWAKILEHAGVTKRPPHSLRHTYASLLLARGEHAVRARPAGPQLHQNHHG